MNDPVEECFTLDPIAALSELHDIHLAQGDLNAGLYQMRVSHDGEGGMFTVQAPTEAETVALVQAEVATRKATRWASLNLFIPSLHENL